MTVYVKATTRHGSYYQEVWGHGATVRDAAVAAMDAVDIGYRLSPGNREKAIALLVEQGLCREYGWTDYRVTED